LQRHATSTAASSSGGGSSEGPVPPSSSSPSSSSSSSSSTPAWDESQFLGAEHLQQAELEAQQAHQSPSVDKQALLRRVLRKAHAAEAAMAHVLAGQQLVLRQRPDAAWFVAQERQALADVQPLLPRCVSGSRRRGRWMCVGCMCAAVSGG
jgi:hypothetical protein